MTPEEKVQAVECFRDTLRDLMLAAGWQEIACELVEEHRTFVLVTAVRKDGRAITSKVPLLAKLEAAPKMARNVANMFAPYVRLA